MALPFPRDVQSHQNFQPVETSREAPTPGYDFDHHVDQSSGHTARTPPGYVPAEAANQRLWAVTTEYENLLRLQKEHQLLTGQRREAEIRHLRAVTDMLTGEANEEDAIASRLHARDQEVAATQKAKQAELELLGAVLVLRDRQIAELQRMCDSKRSQISQFQNRISSADLAHRKNDDWNDVQQLRDRILNMESEVGDKRSELQSLAETLDARTQRLDALQVEVAEAEEHVRQLAGGPVPMKRSDLFANLDMQDKSDSGPQRAALPTRVEAMQEQLAKAQQALKHMVRANVENDNIVRGMANMTPEALISREEESRGTSPRTSISIREQEHPNASPIWSAVLDPLRVISLPSSPHSFDIERNSPASRNTSSKWEQQHGIPIDQVESQVEHVPLHGIPIDQAKGQVEPVPTTEAGQSVFSPSPYQPVDPRSPKKSPSLGFAAHLGRPFSPPRPAFDEPWHLYQPYPGDAVDAMVASFVNQPRNRLRRSLFCRTGFGEYLYGTRKVQLRINPGYGQLEAREVASEDGEHIMTTWTSIEEFTRRLERAQSENLQRARDRVRGAVGRR